MDKLECPLACETNDDVVCGSGGVWIRVVEVIVSGTPGEMVVDGSSEVPSFPGWVTNGAVVPG